MTAKSSTPAALTWSGVTALRAPRGPAWGVGGPGPARDRP